MKNLKKHSVTKISAKLLIVASLLCVLFGNGVHIHSLLEHIFDHGDIHVMVHAHDHSDASGDEGHNHTSDSGNQHHKVAKVDLDGVLSQSRALSAQINFSASLIAVISDTDIVQNQETEVKLNLPPPDIILSEYIPQSNSLRAPPLV